MFWNLGVMLTNTYIIYVKVNTLEYGVKKKDLMT